ncbi:MAG: sulfite exporter TauE/SafE family protein [Isosphaeraceae bacterium]
MMAYWGHEAVLLLSGVAAGLIGAILGTGGGVFLVPFLVLWEGLPMRVAVATSIMSVVATSSAVASANVERGIANMRLGMTLEVATTLGALAGGLTAASLSQNALVTLFAVVLIPTAWLMWRGRTGHERTGESSNNDDKASVPSSSDLGSLGATYFDDAENRSVSYRVERLWGGLSISFLAGNLSGLLGIGGGVFKVPALHLICGVPMKAAAATSNFMVGVTAAAGALLYYGRSEVRPVLTAIVVLGVVAGSALGTHLNRFVKGDAARKLFAALLFLVSLQMLYRAATGKG